MQARVRDFIYLDPVLVAQTLSQIDFGLFEEWQETLERTSGKEGGGGIRLFSVGLSGGASRSSTSGSSIVLQQTAESYISRLLLRLEDEKQLAPLGSDPGQVLRRGTVVSGEGVFEGADFAYGNPGFMFSDDWTPFPGMFFQNLRGEAEPKVPVGTVKGESFAVAAPLDADNLRVGLDELDEEVVEVVGIVRRVFRRAGGDPELMVVVRPIALY